MAPVHTCLHSHWGVSRPNRLSLIYVGEGEKGNHGGARRKKRKKVLTIGGEKSFEGGEGQEGNRRLCGVKELQKIDEMLGTSSVYRGRYGF